jgi:toxin-antitoxin system PIN domain toxin
VKPYLLDVNVLIALAWPSHVHHRQAQDWFARKKEAGFRTCPITEAGFVRISSNPKFSPDAVHPLDALALLDRITSLPRHRFWPDSLSLTDVLKAGQPIVTHRQVSDAYLVALAAAHSGRLATLDRGVLALAGAGGLVEMV